MFNFINYKFHEILLRGLRGVVLTRTCRADAIKTRIMFKGLRGVSLTNYFISTSIFCLTCTFKQRHIKKTYPLSKIELNFAVNNSCTSMHYILIKHKNY